MGEQLSLKAAMPLAEILATCRKNVSNTGPWGVKFFAFLSLMTGNSRRINRELVNIVAADIWGACINIYNIDTLLHYHPNTY